MIGKLRKKIVLVTMIFTTIILLGVLAGIALFYHNTQERDAYARLEHLLDQPRDKHPPDFQIGEKMPEGFGLNPAFVATVSDDGTAQVLFSEQMEVSTAELDELVAEVQSSGQPRGVLRGADLRYLVEDRRGETRIAFTTVTYEYEQLRNVILITSLGVFVAFLLFFAASLLFSRWLVAPVAASWEKQRRFVADASHELKTPLTIILANLGILKAHPTEPIATQMTWVESTEAEATRMKTLVDDLLFLAKGDDRRAQVPMTTLDLSDLVTMTSLSFEPLAFEHHQNIELMVTPGLTVTGHSDQLKQLLAILLDNAVKYGSGDTTIDIQLHPEAGRPTLSVTSRGEPLGPEASAHLFDRFYRADLSRSQEGYGLGLAIAQSIAQRHRGKISVRSQGRETTFTVVFPAVKQ